MTIKIPKLSFSENLIIIILLIVSFNGFISSFIPIFHYVDYAIDILNTVLLISLIKKSKLNNFKKYKVKKIFIWVIILCLVTICTTIPRIESFVLFCWSLRNNFRYFIFFFACIFLSKRGYSGIFDKLFWINFVLSLFEYLILGKSQDWLGGIFGTIGGSVNAPLNLLLVICTARFTILYLIKRKTLLFFSITSLCSMIIASIAELKFFYFEYIIIIILAVLITDFSWRKIRIIFISLLGIFIGANLLFIVFPSLDHEFFSYKFLSAYTTSNQGYTSTGDINRLNFIEQCNTFFKTNFSKFFGLGLGNCETFQLIGLSSSFYKMNSYLHYSWLSSSFMYLETGIIGFFLYFGFFFFLFFQIRGKFKDRLNTVDCRTAEILALIVPLLLLYNLSMRGNEAYLMYYILALPFISYKKC